MGIASGNIGEDPRIEEIEDRVFRIADQFGLDVGEELDEVGVKYLGTYVNARTSLAGSKLRIDFDSQRFFENSDERQRRIILHELIHVKQFNNSLAEWTRKEFDASEEFAEQLDGTIWEDVRSVEGETEMLLSSIFPDQESSYPYAESRKQRSMQENNLDPDSELEKEIDEFGEEIMDEYREVTDVQIEDNLYMEQGTINGEEYTVAVMGEHAAEKGPAQVEDYIQQEILGYDPAEQLSPDLGETMQRYANG